MYIYKIINKINEKAYVGQTTESLEKRFKRHIGYNCRDNDTKFYRAMKKYGIENFYIVEIDNAESQQELDEKEVFWITFYNSINDGYNTATGAIGGDTLTHNPNLVKIREKISQSKVGYKNPQSTPINCINLETGEKVYYGSMKDCQIDMDIPRHDIIHRRCSGKITKPYRNKYTFEYTERQTTIETIILK